jgi:hypothetical protein
VTPPGRTSAAQLLRFYRASLRGWSCGREPGAGPPVLHCRRGHAYVNVDLANLSAATPRYDVVVDYDQRP